MNSYIAIFTFVLMVLGTAAFAAYPEANLILRKNERSANGVVISEVTMLGSAVLGMPILAGIRLARPPAPSTY